MALSFGVLWLQASMPQFAKAMRKRHPSTVRKKGNTAFLQALRLGQQIFLLPKPLSSARPVLFASCLLTISRNRRTTDWIIVSVEYHFLTIHGSEFQCVQHGQNLRFTR